MLHAWVCRLLLARALHRTSVYFNILPYIYWKFHTLYVLIVNLPFMSSFHPVTDYVYPTFFLFCHLQLLRLQFMSEVMYFLCQSPKYSSLNNTFKFLPFFLFQSSSSAVLPVQNFCLWMIAPFCVTSPGSPYQFKHAITFSYCSIQSECRIQN